MKKLIGFDIDGVLSRMTPECNINLIK